MDCPAGIAAGSCNRNGHPGATSGRDALPWGAFVGAIQGIVTIGMLGILLTGNHDGGVIISASILLAGSAFACTGILMRRRYGVVVGGILSLMAILLTVLNLFTSEPEIPPVIRLVRIVIQVVFLGVTADYFSRRWKFMVRPPVQPPPLPKTITESTVDAHWS